MLVLQKTKTSSDKQVQMDFMMRYVIMYDEHANPVIGVLA